MIEKSFTKNTTRPQEAQTGEGGQKGAPQKCKKLQDFLWGRKEMSDQ